MSRAITHLYQFGEFTVDGDQKVLLRNGIPRSLPPKIFDTLLILVENSGRLVGKNELMNQLWPDSFVEESNLTFSIRQLRKSLGDDARQPRFIETVPRRGYRFIAPVEERLSENRSMTARGEKTSAETVDPRPPVTAEIAIEHETTVTAIGWSGARLRKTVLAAAAVVVVLAATIGGVDLVALEAASTHEQQVDARCSSFPEPHRRRFAGLFQRWPHRRNDYTAR